MTNYVDRYVCALCALLVLLMAEQDALYAQLSSTQSANTISEDIAAFDDEILSTFQINNGSFMISANGRDLLSTQNDQALQTTVNLDGEIHILNDSNKFEYKIDTSGNTPVFTWESRELLVQLIFLYPDSLQVQISVVLSNLTNKPHMAGVRLLFDTGLIDDALTEGEQNGYYTATNVYQSEVEFIPDKNTKFLAVRKIDNDFTNQSQLIELVFAMHGENITTPSRVIIANWRRLHQTAWHFRAVKNRRLNLPPYTEIDGAVALYFDPVNIAPKSNYFHQIVLGIDSAAPFRAYPANISLLASNGFDISLLLKILRNIDNATEYIDELLTDTSEDHDDAYESLNAILQEAQRDIRKFDASER